MPRAVPFAVCCLSLALLAASGGLPASALEVEVDDDNGFEITVEGAGSLSAPGNLTITETNSGYRLDWEAPAGAVAGTLAGYRLYRVPGPDTPGDAVAVDVKAAHTMARDAVPDGGIYVYFVTATASDGSESIPSSPVTTEDGADNYPHCGVVSVYPSPPYYDAQISCLFPPPV